MKWVIADTGPLYAAYDPSDQYHAQALQSVQRLEVESLIAIVPYPVLLETHNLILKRLGIQVGLRFLQDISVGAELIHPAAADYELAIQQLYRLPDQTITLCDATTAAISRRLEQPVWAYDFHFNVMGVMVWH